MSSIYGFNHVRILSTKNLENGFSKNTVLLCLQHSHEQPVLFLALFPMKFAISLKYFDFMWKRKSGSAVGCSWIFMSLLFSEGGKRFETKGWMDTRHRIEWRRQTTLSDGQIVPWTRTYFPIVEQVGHKFRFLSAKNTGFPHLIIITSLHCMR